MIRKRSRSRDRGDADPAIKKLYIGNLDYETDERGLEEHFGKIGTIIDVFVGKDRETGRSKGFGFVEFETRQQAETALTMDGQELNGRSISVCWAQPKKTGGSYGGSSQYAQAAYPDPYGQPSQPAYGQPNAYAQSNYGQPMQPGYGQPVYGQPYAQPGYQMQPMMAPQMVPQYGYSTAPPPPGGAPAPYGQQGVAYGNQGVTIKMTGLPYRVTVDEIYSFFGTHPINEGSIEILQDETGRPSGEGLVTCPNMQIANRIVQDLNRQYIGSRYIILRIMK